jgi:hypothetical protein
MTSDDKMNNLVIQDVGAEKDAITNLRAPTHFGRPNVSEAMSYIPLTPSGTGYSIPSPVNTQTPIAAFSSADRLRCRTLCTR